MEKFVIGGWWEVCSQKIIVPSENLPCIVSPKIGLKGLFWSQHIYMLLTINAIQSFILSRWSSVFPAYFKNLGANENKSIILWTDDLGSNILMGKLMWDIERPFNMFIAICLTQCDNTPFCLLSCSSSVHNSPPVSGISIPRRMRSFWVGIFPNPSIIYSSSKGFGGGASF